MNKKIIFIVNGNQNIGMGHVSRCIPIAKSLEKHIYIEFWSIFNKELREYYLNNNISFKFFNSKKEIIQNLMNTESKYILTDSYDLIEDDYRYVKEMGKYVFSIIDFKGTYRYCDILISPNLCFGEDEFECDNQSLKLTGNRYILLKENVINRKSEYSNKKNVLTITLGGSDIYNKTLEILEYVSKWNENYNYKINVIIGPYFNDKELIKNKCLQKKYNIIENCYDISPFLAESRIAIISGGVTLHECLYLNTIPIVYIQAENQIEEVSYLRDINKIIYGGYIDDYKCLNEKRMIDNLNKSSNFMVENGYIDGDGRERIVLEILKFINNGDEDK